MKGPMILSPYKILQEAIKAVPAVRYALGVAGIASVIAIIAGFKINFRVAVFGTLIIFGMMFLLLIFSSLASNRSKRSLRVPALFLAWSFIMLSIMASTLLATSFFFSWPQEIQFYFPSDNSSNTVNITISGEVRSKTNQLIINAKITVDNHNFYTQSNERGQFMSVLRHVNINDVITLRLHHDNYKSYSIDRKIQALDEHFIIELENRSD